MLALSASAGAEGPTSTVKVGLSEGETKAEGTAESTVAPPSQFEAVSLRIEPGGEAGPEGRTGYLMAKRRASEGEGEIFDLRLMSSVSGSVTLAVENVEAIGGRSVALLDPSAGRTYDLRDRQSVTLKPEEKTTDLELAIGTEDYVGNQKEQVLPEEVSLTSYPNPMGRQGTIEYALPEASEVTLKVYDVLGRQVASLVTGRKEAGRHAVRVDTERLSSGVYFGRLRAEGQTRTQKITVVR